MAPARGRFLPLILVAAGCSLDFTVRPQPSDAGGSPADGGDDEASPVVDAGSDAQVSDVFVFDTGPESGVDCNALKADLDEKRRVARLCQQTGAYCTTKVVDECECNIAVGKAGSSASNAYADTIAKFKDGGCVIAGYCQTCPSEINGTCILQNGVTSCYP